MCRLLILFVLLLVEVSPLTAKAASSTPDVSYKQVVAALALFTQSMVKESVSLHIAIVETKAYRQVYNMHDIINGTNVADMLAYKANRMKGIIAPHLVADYVIFYSNHNVPDKYALNKNTLRAFAAACNSSNETTGVTCFNRFAKQSVLSLPPEVRRYYLNKAAKLLQ